MRRFLQETWELFYWALWCPSRLQQRMNAWSPSRERNGVRADTRFQDILLVEVNGRFLSQFFTIIIGLSLPLVFALFQQSRTIDWLLLPIIWLIVYGVAFRCLPVALSIPLLVWWSYIAQPTPLLNEMNAASKLLPPLPVLGSGVGIGALGLGITAATTYLLLQNNLESMGRTAFVVSSILSSGLGSWITTQDLLSTIFVSGAVAFVCLAYQSELNSSSDATEVAGGIAFIVVFGVAVGVAVGVGGDIGAAIGVGVAVGVGIGFGAFAGFVVAVGIAIIVGDGVGGSVAVGVGVGTGVVVGFVVAVGIAVGIAGVAQLPLVPFLLVGGLLATSFSPLKHPLWGVWLVMVMVMLGVEHLSWRVGWAIPTVMVSYYRILPDFAVLLLWQFLVTLPFINRFSTSRALSKLRRLPPHSSELLWLPLPGHAQLLTDAFRLNSIATLPTLQQMQVSSLPSFQHTLRQALPQIVARQLTDIRTVSDLRLTASSAHPILPLLVPSFYQSELTAQRSSVIASDLAIVLPKFQEIAEDVGGALEASNAALRERGLDRILNKLTALQAQLPGMGLKMAAIRRWQPVMMRWQSVIQLELEEQKKQSQGELLNPFQFGNPLRQERSHLFKGRRTFSDRVYRLVLDRNRPTLVLHGPRRCGKSSFLLNLSRLLPSDLVPVYIDMQRAGISNSEADFCYGLANAIYRDSRSQGIVLPNLPKRAEFYQNPYPFLEDWLDEALPELGDRRLLLNLDEFEKIGSAIQEKRLSLRLFDELRSLIQHTDQLGFLFSGVQTLDELGPNWSSYFISVVPMEMLYLEQNEAEELLLDPDPEFTLRYDSGIIPETLRLTHCQPYLLQLIGSALVTQANLEHTQLVTPLMLEAAIQDAFTLGEPYFTNVWTEFTGTTSSEIAVGQAYLLWLTGRILTPPDPSLPETQAAICRLRRYHVIEQTDGSDRIEIPLFEQWVREQAIAA